MKLACGTANRCELCPARLINNTLDEDKSVAAAQAVYDAYGVELVGAATYAKRDVLVTDVYGADLPVRLRSPVLAILHILSNGGCIPTNIINQ